MEAFETNAPKHSVEVTVSPECVTINAKKYRLTLEAKSPYIKLTDSALNEWADFFIAGNISTTTEQDETESIEIPTVTKLQDCVELRVNIKSSLWQSKQLVWRCFDDFMQAYYQVEGSGDLQDCDYFAGNYLDAKSTGYYPSGAHFDKVFNPEPTVCEVRSYPADRPSSIDVTGNFRPGRESWLLTPPPYCFGFNKNEDTSWLMLGVNAPIEQQNFTGAHYDGRERAFSLRLSFEGHTSIDGKFQTPSVLMHFADDPYTGIEQDTKLSQKLGFTNKVPRTEKPGWWQNPIFCGWGAQVELAEQNPGQSMQDYARQDTYDELLNHLESQGIKPGTIVIDDKWQTEYGTNIVDTEKWPDLKAWIARRHMLGQKVLLWLKAWDADGLSSNMCVTTKKGKSVTADPSNPEYEEFLRHQVRRMLGPGGYNADGFKIDFTANTPSGNSLKSHGNIWGTHLLHKLLQIIYTEAKQTKPDAVVITHTPNAYFNDVTDMIRLNDVNHGTSVVEQMTHRAKVADAACPNKLIDTDNWPMPNKSEWRKYLKVQRTLGVPALYFATHINGEPLTTDDYQAIKVAWQKLSD